MDDSGQAFGGGRISVRDYFAGQALIGLVPLLFERATAGPRPLSGPEVTKLIAATAFEIADSMLKERD